MNILARLWTRLFPVRHPTRDELARNDLTRQLRWRTEARLERAIRANRLDHDDERLVRREYRRLVEERGTLGGLSAAIDYAAQLAKSRAAR